MNIPFNPGDKVFGYGRDSGGDEQDLSVGQQEDALRKWCTENGIILTHFYKDEARKGSSTVTRDELHLLMHQFRRDCSERGVIVWKYNRFARSVDNAQFLRAEIRTLGYIFHSITDQVPDGPMGRLFEAAIDFKDEQYLIDLSIDTKRGLYDLVERFGCVPGGLPIGMKKTPIQIGTRRDGSPHIAHRRDPDPAFKPRVLKAFEMRAAHASIGQIHQETRLLGGINSYHTFFANPIYKGTLRFGDYIKDNYCEAMIPEELWDQVQIVQNKFERKKHMEGGADHPRRANSSYLLSGIIHCALCGSPMFGRTTPQKSGNSSHAYACSRAWRKRDCSKKSIPAKVIEPAVLQTLTHEILQPENIVATYNELQANQSTQLAEQEAERKDLAGRLKVLRKKITNATNTIMNIGAKKSKALTNALLDLEAQETEIETRIAALNASAIEPVPKIEPDVLFYIATNFLQIYQKAELEERRLLLRLLIDHIDVRRDNDILYGMIYYYYPPKVQGPEERAVSISPSSSGPPRYRHIAQIAFSVTTRDRANAQSKKKPLD